MNDEQLNAAREEAEDMARAVPRLLEALADKLGASAGAQAVFGDPVSEGGRTVIPVAHSMVGTGAGGGSSADAAEGSGIGAGGGAMARPLGYIEVSSGGAAFVPLKKPWQDPGVILAYAVIVLIVSRAAVKLVRG